jgi:hypothetical protein
VPVGDRDSADFGARVARKVCLRPAYGASLSRVIFDYEIKSIGYAGIAAEIIIPSSVTTVQPRLISTDTLPR